MAAADTARLLAALDMDDRRFQAGVKRSLGSLGKLDKGISGVGKNLGRIGKGFGKGAAIVGGAAVAGLVIAGKAAIDFQDAFQGVVKTVEATPEQFDQISDALRRMSTEIPISAIELARIAEQGGAMGVKAKDIESFTRQVAILASTTNVSADDAATALGQLQNVIGLTGDEFDNFAAALVDLGNKGSSTESQILEIARRSGGAAKLIGIAKDATLGWAAAAANLGLSPELAGTALQNFYVKTQAVVGKGGDALRRFAKVAGLDAKAFAKAFRKDASGALEKFVTGLKGMSKGDRLRAVQQFFGKGSGLTRLILGLADSVDQNLNPALEDSAKAWDEATAAQIEFDKRNATVRSSITRLKNTFMDAAITVGEGFAPAVGRAADRLSEFLKDPANRTALKSIGEDIGKAIDSVDWSKLLQTAKSLGQAFKPALDLLLKIAETIGKLPPEVIGAGGAVLLTDRLSGGAVSSAAGGAIGGLAEAFAKSMAAKVPLFGKAFVQPVFVTNMGAGLPGVGPSTPGGKPVSTVGKVLDVASKIVIVGLVAEAAQQLSPVIEQFGRDLHKSLKIPDLWDPSVFDPSNLEWPWGPKNTPTILPEIFGGNGLLGGTPEMPGTGKPSTPAGRVNAEGWRATTGALRDVKTEQARAAESLGQAVGSNENTTRGGLSNAVAATNTGSSRIVGAIAANRPIVNVDVQTNVSATSVEKNTTVVKRYGPINGSAGGHGGGGNIAG